MNIDIRKVTNMSFGDVHTWDYPDFCDAFLESADIDDREMTEDELDFVTTNYPGFIHESVLLSLY